MRKILALNLPLLLTILIFSSCKNEDDDIKLFPIKAGEKWGYVDKEGKYVINSQFADAFNFSEGLALCKSSEGKWGFIDMKGKYVINPIYKDASKFSEGLACVVMENGKPQFINKEGKILFTVDKAEYCQGFSEGLAEVKIKGKWGYIDNTGKLVISAIYENSNPFSEGLAAVSKIDEKSKQEKWGFIDKNGAVKISFQFIEDKEKFLSRPNKFLNGLVFVTNDGKQWGCINKDGKYRINPQFEGSDGNLYGFVNGASLIAQGGTFGYINEDGKYIINPQFKFANAFAKNGLAAVEHSDGKWGFINKDGKYEINPQFDGVAIGFKGNIAFVKASDKYGIIDNKGLYILNPQFDDVKLYDIGFTYGVKSDYVDNQSIAEQIFNKSNDSTYQGYSDKTTLNQIIDEYPDKKIDDLKEYGLTIEKPNVNISDMIKISSLHFGFKEKTFSETPIYKTVQKYDYYYGYYNAKEIDKWDKKLQTETPLSYTSLTFTLESNGKGKGKALAAAIQNEARKILKVSPKEDINIINTDYKGLYLLTSPNFLVYITYRQKEDDQTAPATINLSVVNKNIDKGFEELAKKLAEDFN